MALLMPVKNLCFLRFFYGTAAKTPFGTSFLKTVSKSQVEVQSNFLILQCNMKPLNLQ